MALADQLRTGSASAGALLDAYLQRIRKYDAKLHAFVAVYENEARMAAELADRHYRLGAVQIATFVELQKQYLEAVEGLLDTKKETLEAAQQLELLTGLATPLANTSAEEEKK